ncbi:MAG: hypothetical protein DME69_08640 [Verrucomicrobia bacterium]|nr:MAG: hypothetical protein DME69_08640 [Verrucomicrobiota bacterium]
MNEAVFTTIAITGFTVAFFHAAIPTHWRPFVLTTRAQRWNHAKAFAITALAGSDHVIFTVFFGFAPYAVWVRVTREDRKRLPGDRWRSASPLWSVLFVSPTERQSSRAPPSTWRESASSRSTPCIE